MSERLSIAIRTAEISPELLAYLQSSDILTCAESALAGKGFFECCDQPRCPDHVYYEGYFHGLDTPLPVESMNPRLGDNMQKPAAPIEFRAFAAALRSKNADWIQECCAGDTGLALLFQQLNVANCAFADLAVQVHYKQEIPERLIGWHRDAVNSTLHCAVSLRGARTLHARVADSAVGPYEVVTLPQQAGNVYVACPYAFGHAVQYPASDWAARTVAVQLRWLLTQAQHMQLSAACTPAETCELLRTVSTALCSARLAMPTLQEVQDQAARLSALAASVAAAAGPMPASAQQPLGWSDSLASMANRCALL